MSKEIEQRFAFVNHVLGWEGQINATHIAVKFQLSRQAASATLKQYRGQFPEHVEYNSSEKAFIATEQFNNYFKQQHAFNDFSNYLAAIATSDDQSGIVSGIALEVEAPLRNVNPLQIRHILRAIREKLQIDIGYISLSSPSYLDRIIQPHSLIFDGLRWHVRAYCNKNAQFRDFTLSRFNGDAVFEGTATHTQEHDEKWNTFVDVVIEADSRFSAEQKCIIEKDFQMQQGCRVIPTRAALVNYLLRRLHIDEYKSTPQQQQIVLTKQSYELIRPYLVQPI